MQTLKELRSGVYKDATKLTLSEGLTHFPQEIFELAETLEFLDLSNNLLSELPEDLHRLKKLKIAFFSFNRFTTLPHVFKELKHLYMLGFKGNQIAQFDEDILPPTISWLILTDNKLTQLPRSIGRLTKLQKFPLAGNALTSLPDEMAACRDLELLRLSANQLQTLPSWLLALPKLSWLAFSGNPCSQTPHNKTAPFNFEHLELHELLGQGASGHIYKAYANNLEKEVAVKLFKGAITSDGYAQDEINAYMNTGFHSNLIQVLGHIQGVDQLGLVLEYIPSSYESLGNVPNFETCTRDTFQEGTFFDIQTIYAIVGSMLSVACQLHEKALMHGDLYAHNILIDHQTKHAFLGDFGAASFYDPEEKAFERIEVRAFGCLIEDLLSHTLDRSRTYEMLHALAQSCMNENSEQRPLFCEISLDKNRTF